MKQPRHRATATRRPLFLQCIFAIGIAAAGLFSVSDALADIHMDLRFANVGDISGSNTFLAIVHKGQSVPLTAYLDSDQQVPATGVAFTLTQVSGPSNGMLSITARNFANSVFDDTASGHTNAEVLKSPFNLLDPANDYDLGRSTVGKVPVHWTLVNKVEDLTLTVKLTAPLGTYGFQATAGSSYAIGEGPDFAHYSVGGKTYYITVGDTQTITFSGDGAGSLSVSNVARCTSTAPCTFLAVPNQNILLQVYPDVASTLGAISLPGCIALCKLGNVPGTFDIRFDLKPNTLRVVQSGSGHGTITSDPAVITCPSNPRICAVTIDPPGPVVLTAHADPGFVFVGWQGPCSGIGACATTTDVSKTITAMFLNPATDPPHFVANPARKSLGTVPVGSHAEGTVVIANQGAPGSISDVAITGDSSFTLSGGSCQRQDPLALAFGGSCTLAVSFAPTSAGTHMATIVVQTDGDPDPLMITLTGTGGGVPPASRIVTVREYYNAAMAHYFMTSDPNEQAALGQPPFADWQPTARAFNAFDTSQPLPAGAQPVCRFFNASFASKSSHFYGLPEVCAQTIALFPDWQLESASAFGVYAPNGNGDCPNGSMPVYRLYNNGQGGAPNHRFVTAAEDRDAMIGEGYVSEGAGPLGVGMCAPQ